MKEYKIAAEKEAEKQQWMRDKLDFWQANQLSRQMRTLQSAQSSHVRWNGKNYLMLASNSYLNFCHHPEIIKYAQTILQDYGTGSGGSRLTTGNTFLHEQLEEALAAFKGTEAALAFTSGYVANCTVLQSVCQEGDVIFSDALNHASIIDGCRLSKAETVIYAHNDMEDLKNKVRSHAGRRGVVVSDAVFSMDGDIVDLPKLMEIAEKNGLLSMIDEAHSTGVLGKTGRGITEYYGMQKKPDILIGTLSKAFGGEGGFVCGSETLVKYLQHTARGFVFSTAPSPVSVAAAYKAVKLLENDPTPVQKLQSNIAFFVKCLQEYGVPVQSDTAIIPIVIGNEADALQAAERLLEQGYYVSAIRYPTVAKNSARLRVALMATHTHEELQRAAREIVQVVSQIKKAQSSAQP